MNVPVNPFNYLLKEFETASGEPNDELGSLVVLDLVGSLHSLHDILENKSDEDDKGGDEGGDAQSTKLLDSPLSSSSKSALQGFLGFLSVEIPLGN